MLEDISRKAEKRMGKDRRHWGHYKYQPVLNRNYFTRGARRERPHRHITGKDRCLKTTWNYKPIGLRVIGS
jgi:hypothetical protein